MKDAADARHPVGVRCLASADAACLVTAPVRHDANRSTAAARANEAVALGDQWERRSIFNAGGGKGERGRVKTVGVRARHVEGAYAHRFQVCDGRRQHAARLHHVNQARPIEATRAASITTSREVVRRARARARA